jgi:phenylpropionate dioxygenase-like ring-hydroxylating dioxygenase large terminal subunit
MNELPASFHKQMGEIPDGVKVDRWQVTHYGPPAFVKLDVGSSPVGTGARQGDRSKGVNMWNLNAITPETEKTTHYFWSQAWNFRLDERWIGDMLKQQIHTIFLEDQAMIRAQQQNMDLGPASTVSLGQDKAWVAMRGIVQRLIGDEQQGQRLTASVG